MLLDEFWGPLPQQVVRVSNFYFDAHGDVADRWIVCHEVGHALGLVHRTAAEGCMWNGSGIRSSVDYTPHDRAHLGANWDQEARHIGAG
ncbi:hypothetical protein [Nocardioides jishulii]|uniref:Matrixin family metalloprotease n=1 Tax=Nocardioides jishulii TaxID=2575440 RepID=A0A4U2YT16_9ACTN|nr:hypothetical protein [Nocardioides jishulii]QCX26251.1 hypothetical protein FCL41_00870 [Nocardioides jishulii]TKI63945.1 hypothetical protein FC770_01835 [Nocardioides jishulii]